MLLLWVKPNLTPSRAVPIFSFHLIFRCDDDDGLPVVVIATKTRCQAEKTCKYGGRNFNLQWRE